MKKYCLTHLFGPASIVLWIFSSVVVQAQDETILYGVADPGVTTSITNWGLGVIGGSDVMTRGMLFMGSNQVDEVILPFTMEDPLTNGQLSAESEQEIYGNLQVADLAGKKPLMISSGTGDGVNSWYITGANEVNPSLWASNMIATEEYIAAQGNISRPIKYAMPFNEPDYAPWNQGSPQNLDEIMGLLLSSTNFSSIQMGGGTTLDDDAAISWYDAVENYAVLGTTHCLAGSVSSYESFIQTVQANGAIPFNPEAHNLVETIIGANYGLKGAIWWLAAELARGDFVNESQGQQLGYAENDNNWTAAAVYRGTNGTVQAFLGGSERMGITTSYRFFSRDQNVFYNGTGPQRDYTVSISGNSEQVVNINWGADVPPPIGGRYIIANRNSGLVMEVPNASVNNGVFLNQIAYTGASNQLWDISPIPASFGGDLSYYTITAAHDGVTADEYGWSYANGNPIDQWNGGTNAVEQWYFQYAGNGCFYIRSRWSDDCVEVSGAALTSGAPIVQWSPLGTLDQQWRLIPVGNLVPTGNPISFVAPATPTGLTATANAVSIQLNWNAVSSSTPVSYTVLCGTNSGGPYNIIGRGLTNTAFLDNSADQPRINYYVVAAMDGSLDQSAYSTAASAAPTLAPTWVANYNFESNALDSSGNGNNAEAVGSPGYAQGASSWALSLDSTDQYVMAPAGIMAGVTNFTIAAWVNWNGGVQWQRIFDFGNGVSQYMFLTPDSGNGTLRFAITTNYAGGEQIIETSPLPVGQWVHVAVTLGNNTAHLYTNGVLAASGNITISPANFNPALNNFGASQYPTDPYFSGLLDSVYIYNYALTSSQILNLTIPAAPGVVWATPGSNRVSVVWEASVGATSYVVERSTTNGGPYNMIASGVTATTYTDTTAANGTTYYYVIEATAGSGQSSGSSQAIATPGSTMVNLLDYWRFDEGAGVTAYDSAGTNNGTLAGGCSWTMGIINDAVSLNGNTNAYVSFRPGIVSSLTNFTVAAWVNLGASNAWQRIFDFGSGTGSYMFLTPEAGSGGVLRFAITTNGNGTEQQINGPSTLSAGVWHHVAVTLSNNLGILYEDGMAVGTNSSMTLRPGTLGNTTANTIGQSQFSIDPHLLGDVDDFRIYPSALSSRQVAALTAGPSQLNLSENNGALTFAWNTVWGSLEFNTNLDDPNGWTMVTNSSPYMIPLPSSGSGFYRVLQ